jgi:hypothetical protein
MSGNIINPAAEAQKKSALNIGHQLLLVDQLLKVDSNGYQVQVSIGWETPQGTLMPVATIVMPIPFASELADALNKAVKEGNTKREKKK